MNPVLVSIAGFDIHYYSVLILIAIIVAGVGIVGQARRWHIPKQFITNMMFWVLILSIICARLYYVAFNFDYYQGNLVEIVQIWKGGLAIHGGLIGGAIGIALYCKKYKVNILRMYDVIVPYLILAQAIGRWGNFFNQEAYGTASTLEALQGIKLFNLQLIPNFVIDGMNIGGVYYTPTFYYECVWCILGFIVLLIFRSLKYTHVGQTAGLYLVWYSVGRFVIESMRLDSLMFGDFKVAQIVSVLMFVGGLVMILAQARKPKLEELYNDITYKETVVF